METCIGCGEATATVELLHSYDDDGFGIPITMKNAVLRHHCDHCGMDGIEIPDTEGLISAVAVARILSPIGLTGHEIRAVRKACGMNGVQFAKALDVNNAALSRWENADDDRGLGEVAERNLRSLVWETLKDKLPAFSVDFGYFRKMQIRNLPAGQKHPRLVLERVRLKDRVNQSKSDEWDMHELAA